MKNLLAAYKKYLEENSSLNTALSYMSDLLKFINEHNITKKRELIKIKSTDIEEYISLLKSRGMAYSSIARTVASLKKFFFYCSVENIVTNVPTAKIAAPKIRRKLPNTISVDDVVSLLEAPDTSSVKGMRDKAMLEVMYATGARVSELIGMKVEDVTLKNEMAVLATGGKHRFVPLGREAVSAVYAYIKDARGRLANEESGDVLFLNLQGQPLTRQGFWKIIKHYISAIGITGNVTPQTIRHCFALHLLKNGADVHSVSEMLGYSDVASTKIYMDVMNSKIKEVYKSAHPRA